MVTYSMVISIIMDINRYSIWFTFGSHWFIWFTFWFLGYLCYFWFILFNLGDLKKQKLKSNLYIFGYIKMNNNMNNNTDDESESESDDSYVIGIYKAQAILKKDGIITPETMPLELYIDPPPAPNEFILHCKYCNGTKKVNKKTQSHDTCAWKRNPKNPYRLKDSPPFFTHRGTLLDGKDKEWKKYIDNINNNLPHDNFSKIHYTKYKSNYFKKINVDNTCGNS